MDQKTLDFEIDADILRALGGIDKIHNLVVVCRWHKKSYQELIDSEIPELKAKQLAIHKTMTGNRPSNTLLLKKITPRSLGSLLALYEHKIFVQGVIWRINSFDQWGVEFGKQLANKIGSSLINPENLQQHDSSTKGLIEYYLKRIKK